MAPLAHRPMRAAVIALVALTATGTASMVWTVESADLATALVPSARPSGNVEPALDPTPPGKVAVVASSAPVDGQIAVVVANGSTRPVRDVRVSASATIADGGRASKATNSLLVPDTLAPGEIALGALNFPASDVPAGAVFSFEVKSRKARSRDRSTALDVGSFTLSPPLVGDVAQTLGLTVTNPSSHAIKGPVDVQVVCFGEAREPAFAVDAPIKRKQVAPRASVTTTVKLHELCPSYLVAAQGQSAG